MDTIANILMTLKGDTDDGETKLKKFLETVHEVGRTHETATVAVKVEGETKLAATLKTLNEISRTKATARVEVQVDRTRLDKALDAVRELGASSRTDTGGDVLRRPELQKPIDRFSLLQEVPRSGGDAIKKIGDDTEVSGNKLEQFFARIRRGFENLRDGEGKTATGIDRLTHAGEDFITKFGPGLKIAESGLTALSKGIAGALDAIGGSSGIIGGPTSALASVFEKLGAAGPTAFIPLLAIIPLVTTAISALIAAVIALGASLASAAAGLGAIVIALGAALGPALILAIGLFKELAQVIQAVQASTKDQTGRQNNLEKALLTQRAAQDRLTNASVTGNKATVNALQQQRDAVLAVQNAYLSLQSAKLGIEDAHLALERANEALKNFKANLSQQGLTLGNLKQKTQDVQVGGLGQQNVQPLGQTRNAELEFDTLQQAKKRALLGVLEANQRVTDATNTYQKAQANATTGTLGSVAATNAASAAARRLEAANIAVARAQLAVSHAKGTDALNGLSKAGQALVPIFKQVVDALKQFQPALDPILRVIGLLATGLLPIMKQLAPVFISLGKTLAASFKEIGKTLESPEFVLLFKGFIKDSAELVKVVTPGFIAFLKILFQIAKDAMPALLKVFKIFSDALTKIANNPNGIKQFVDVFVHSFLALIPVIGAVVGFLGRLIKLAAPIGDSLFGEIAKFFNDLLSTQSSRDDFKKWLSDGVENFKRIAKGVGEFIANLGPLLGILNSIGGAIIALFGPWDHLSFIGKLFRLVGLTIGATFGNAFKIIEDAIKIVIFSLNGWFDIFKVGYGIVSGFVKILTDGFGWVVDLIKQAVGLIPNLTGSVSIPLIGNINPFHHAEGGIATRATAGIFGEAGPEGIIPLTDRVFGALASALAPQINVRLAKSHTGKDSVTRHQTNHFAITAPAGQAPDANHLMAAIEQRLTAIGAA